MTLVSIIIPTYKRPTKLSRAIDSALAQEGNFNTEIIVVDDNNNGDNDRLLTEKLIKRYEGNDRVKYIKHDKNKNGSAARNTGIKFSSGDYITFLDDDDFFLPGRIKNAILTIESENLAGVCCGYVKNNGKFFYKLASRTFQTSTAYELLSLKYDFGAGSTLFLKRDVFQSTGLFDESFYKHQDWEFLIRYFRYYNLKVTADISVVICSDGYRSVTSSDKLLTAKKQLRDKYLTDINKFNEIEKGDIYEAQYTELLSAFLKHNEYRSFSKFLKNLSNNYHWYRHIPNYIYSILQGTIPEFTNYILFLLLDCKYRSKHGALLNSIHL